MLNSLNKQAKIFRACCLKQRTSEHLGTEVLTGCGEAVFVAGRRQSGWAPGRLAGGDLVCFYPYRAGTATTHRSGARLFGGRSIVDPAKAGRAEQN
jgi:hypothetical protein